MLGLFLALAILGLKLIGGSLGLAVISAGHFLWCWYWVFFIIKGVILAVMGLLITLGVGLLGLGAGLETNSKGAAIVTSLLGLGAGAGLSLLICVAFVIKNILLLAGSYLLMTAFIPATAQWVIPNLIIGPIMILIGIFAFRSKKTKEEQPAQVIVVR